jgi:hypothetical protein
VLLRQLTSVAKNLIKAQPVSNRTVIIGVSKRAAEQPTTHRRQSYRWTKETTYTFAKAAEEFAQAWRDPHHTRIGLPAIDVNKTLAERYIVDAPIHVTLGMVWAPGERFDDSIDFTNRYS